MPHAPLLRVGPKGQITSTSTLPILRSRLTKAPYQVQSLTLTPSPTYSSKATLSVLPYLSARTFASLSQRMPPAKLPSSLAPRCARPRPPCGEPSGAATHTMLRGFDPRTLITLALATLVLSWHESFGEMGIFCYLVGQQLFASRRSSAMAEPALACSSPSSTSFTLSTTSRD